MTIKALAEAVGVPQSTIRLYRDEFEEFIDVTGQGRKRRYSDDGMATLRRIVAWKREGWAAGRIRDELAKERQPIARLRRQTVEERLDEITALLRAQAGEVAMLRAEVGALRAETRRMAAAAVESAQEAATLTLEDALLGSGDD